MRDKGVMDQGAMDQGVMNDAAVGGMTGPWHAPDLAQVGDRPPHCFGMSPGKRFYSFEEQYGRPVVLIMAGARAWAALMPIIDAFTAARDRFADRHADILLLGDDAPSRLFANPLPELRIIDSGAFINGCGVGADDSLILLLDRNMRIALRLHQGLSPGQPQGQPSRQQSAAVDACLQCLDRLPREAPRDIVQPAPLLVLPNLVSQEQCRFLIDRFENSPTIDGELARIDATGAVRSVVDHTKKHRRDYMVDSDEALHARLQATLLRRCAPEIAKAFQVHVSHTDRILVSRYDETGGWFRRHRDNAARNIAFREFALSVVLNTGAFEGGNVIFPEYNDHLHSVPAGAGVIFSTSVLHEVTPVTKGRRYVLLTFFHSAAAEVRRLAYFAGDPTSVPQ